MYEILIKRTFMKRCIKYTTQFYQTYIIHNDMDFYKEANTCVLNVVNKNKTFVFKDM